LERKKRAAAEADTACLLSGHFFSQVSEKEKIGKNEHFQRRGV